ncbi:MAG: phage tail sheath C-terminal domain-containing protein [Telluria sp.]
MFFILGAGVAACRRIVADSAAPGGTPLPVLKFKTRLTQFRTRIGCSIRQMLTDGARFPANRKAHVCAALSPPTMTHGRQGATVAATRQSRTPGVHIVEQGAVPAAVIEVPTAVPAFIGYTETAADGPLSIAGVPTRIDSLADYVRKFGAAPTPSFTLEPATKQESYLPALKPEARFFLYHSLLLYFLNGGGPAYVVSIGTFDDAATQGRSVHDFTLANPASPAASAPLEALEKVTDVTLIVAPDTTLLPAASDCYAFWQLALAHCACMQGRMAIIDIYDGYLPRTYDPGSDVIAGAPLGLREAIGVNFLDYGAAYYPWLNFDVVPVDSITFDSLDDTALGTLAAALGAELAAMTPQPAAPLKARMATLYARIGQRLAPDPSPLPPGAESRADQVIRTHHQLLDASPLYKRLQADMLTLANQLPPAAAMAGVYAQTDAGRGVWRAPANIGIASAVSPVVDISGADQEDLNKPLDGKAVNAIRTIAGRGLVVWGARTLDGNSPDRCYINVRRTLIMFEQSIKAALLPYVFAPNVATTWVSVQSMISNFLTDQWKAGALAGAKAQDAFSVAVGLGSTMTAEDVLDGYMRVAICVAVVRPAEFIELTFQQQMQVS